MELVPIPVECPCCTQVGRLFTRVVNGTGERIVVCEECFVSWREGDALVCGTALVMGDRVDARGDTIDWDHLSNVDDPTPLPGSRTMSNRARKRRRIGSGHA